MSQEPAGTSQAPPAAPQQTTVVAAGPQNARYRLRFTGSFGDYFLKSLGLLVLSIFTLGLAIPYWMYWQWKYFFDHMEMEQY